MGSLHPLSVASAFALAFNVMYPVAAFEPCSYSKSFICSDLGSALVWLPFIAQACGVAIALVGAGKHKEHRHAPAIGLGLGLLVYLTATVGTELIFP